MVEPVAAVAALCVTLAAFAAIGLWRSRAERGAADVEDYIVARNSQTARTLGLSFLASGTGAWILFAPPEIGAFVGVTAVVGYAVAAAAPLVVFAVLGRRLRRIAPLGRGLAEFVHLRFGGAFHAYVIAISVLYMLFFVTAELTAVGGILAILSGADPRIAILATAAATLAYTAYGGLRASLRTDRWQGWIIIVLMAAAAAAVLSGGPAADSAALPAGDLRTVDGAGLTVAVTLVIAVTAANMFHHGYWQRVWAARDLRALDRGVAFGAGATVPVVLAVGLLGVVAAERGLALGSPPVPFFALLTGLPAWVGVVVLVLGLALVASSVDTLENGLAAMVVAARPQQASLAGARLITVVLMLPAVAVAVQGRSVLQLFLIADLLCAATVAPALLGLWPRATAAGAIAGSAAGLAGAVLPGWVTTGSLVEGALLATFPGAVPTLPPFLGALVASSAVAVAVSLAGKERVDLAEVGARVPALAEGP